LDVVIEIGPTIRDARMHRRIDITEVESATKIRAKYLRAIENEEWDLLPGPVYIRSFLKTYGDYLGLDSRLLVDEFKRRYELPPEHDRPLAAITRERAPRGTGAETGRGIGGSGGGRPPRRFPIRGQWLAVGVVVVAIVAALFVVGLHGKGRTDTGGGVVTPAGNGHSAKAHKHPKKTPTKTVVHHHPPPATDATLDLVPTGAVWVCVENPADKILVPGKIYSVGETIPKASGKELLVSLGNGNVTAKVNGKAYTVAQSGSSIALKITPTGAQTTSSGPTCS
jgi:cytoskeleton protein RodZ